MKKTKTPPKKQPVVGHKTTEKPAKQKKSEKLGNIFDVFVKNMLGRIFLFADFLKHYADPNFIAQIKLANITAVPTHLFGKDGVERIVDLIFRCPLKHGGGLLLAVIIFEHQSTSLQEIPQKLLKFITSIWEEDRKAGRALSAPYFIVLRTGAKPHRKPYPRVSDMLPKDENGNPIGSVLDIQYDVVDLPAYDFAKLLGLPHLRLFVGILKKMTEGREAEFGEALLPLQEFQSVTEQQDWLRDILPFVNKVFLSHGKKLENEMLQQAVEPIFTERTEKMMLTLFEEAELRGKADGKAEGKAEGKVEGKVEGKAESILQVLKTRFNRTPSTLDKKLSKITSMDKLTMLLERALYCESLKSFSNSLN